MGWFTITKICLIYLRGLARPELSSMGNSDFGEKCVRALRITKAGQSSEAGVLAASKKLLEPGVLPPLPAIYQGPLEG